MARQTTQPTGSIIGPLKAARTGWCSVRPLGALESPNNVSLSTISHDRCMPPSKSFRVVRSACPSPEVLNHIPDSIDASYPASAFRLKTNGDVAVLLTAEYFSK